jgi:hypothetical protein
MPRFLSATIILLFALLSGCAKYFEEPMTPDTCWLCFDKKWTAEDVHVHVNRVVADKYYQVKRPHFNGTCLEAAEMKYELAESQGIKGEIVILRLHREIEYWREATSPLHAVYISNGIVYDNGFLSDMPFDEIYLDEFGNRVPDVWSDYRRKR